MYNPSHVQTAGESQYQDRPPPGHRSTNPFSPDPPKTDPATNPFASPPPVSAPPPPPPSEYSDNASVRSVGFGDADDDSSSGQQTASPPVEHRYPSRGGRGDGRSIMLSGGAPGDRSFSTYQSAYAAVPAITNYGISPVQTFYPSGSSSTASETQHMDRFLRGDTAVRPNTGQTNDEFGGFGSLREVTARLRWSTIVCTLSSLIWEGFAFPARLLVHTWDHPAKVVLGGYLAFFSLLLLGVELNAPMQDLFGVLYHPLGRAVVLALLSTMCYAISIAWWEIILCAAFAGCSAGYLYAYVKYPEYRRWQDYNDNRIWSDMRQAVQASRVGGGYGNSSSAYWADPGSERSPGIGHIISTNQSWANTQRETQSLLHQI